MPRRSACPRRDTAKSHGLAAGRKRESGVGAPGRSRRNRSRANAAPELPHLLVQRRAELPHLRPPIRRHFELRQHALDFWVLTHCTTASWIMLVNARFRCSIKVGTYPPAPTFGTFRVSVHGRVSQRRSRCP